MTPEQIAALAAAIIACLGSIGAWFKAHTDVSAIQTDREATKAARDEDSRKMHDQIIILEQTVGNLKADNAHLQNRVDDTNQQINTLTTQLAQVIVKMDNIIDTLKELKKAHND